jgi:hypothetical protein
MYAKTARLSELKKNDWLINNFFYSILKWCSDCGGGYQGVFVILSAHHKGVSYGYFSGAFLAFKTWVYFHFKIQWLKKILFKLYAMAPMLHKGWFFMLLQ